jgi:hypothetical protein
MSEINLVTIEGIAKQSELILWNSLQLSELGVTPNARL